MEEIKSEESGLDFGQYYHLLVKHRALIVLTTILVVCVTVWHTVRLRPVYLAAATMAIEEEKTRSPITGQQLIMEDVYAQSVTFKTHVHLMTSRPVLDRVIQILELAETDAIDRQAAKMEVSSWRETVRELTANLRLLLGLSHPKPDYQASLNRLKGALKGKIRVSQIPDTRLLHVYVEDHDPQMARDIANALARAYIEFNLENRLKSTESSMSWMQDQLYETKQRLEDAEAAFVEWKEREKLFSVEGQKKILASQIQDARREYAATRDRRLALDRRLNELNQIIDVAPSSTHLRLLDDNPLVQGLYTQLLNDEVELGRLGKVFKSKHPKIVQLESRIGNTRQKLREEFQKEIRTLATERDLMRDKERQLERAIDDYEAEALGTTRKELQYTILERNVDANQKLYDILVSKVEESNITSDIDVSNIRVVEEATLPGAPIRPNKKRSLMMGLLLGLLAGVGLAFLREYIDQTLHTEEDVQKYLGLPVLAVVPLAEKGAERTYGSGARSEGPASPPQTGGVGRH